jgi:two-component system, LuxR family, response regulator FixJ
VSGSLMVHVVDDDEDVRASLALLFETMGQPVTCYGSATALLEAAAGLAPGCILTDVRMPDLDGLALQRRLAEIGVRHSVIVMTGHADVPLAVAALKAGAVDFIEKPFDEDTLLAAVQRALARQEQQQAGFAAVTETNRRLGTLTPREREVMDGMVAGKPNKVIAYDLGTSPRTVEVHRARVMEKMAVRSLPELVRMVLEAGASTGERI